MRSCVGLALLLLCIVSARAETVRVGIEPEPPFAMADGDGGWTGISVELWQRIADQLGWQTKWVLLDNPGKQIEELAAGKIDVAVGALTVTSEREAAVDFSVPFFSSELAIATPIRSSSWFSVLERLLSLDFLRAIGVLALVLLAVGVLVWLVERKRNPGHFGGSVAEGVAHGFWWSAVTMTAVGYGDKVPVTVAGRVLAIVWMFVSVIAVSGFAAGIASSITLQRLGTVVNNVSDLSRVRCTAVRGSTGEQFLRKRGIRALLVETPETGIALLRNGDADAMVHDEPLIRYLLKDAAPGIEILPLSSQPQYYAFGLQAGSTAREKLNRVLLSDTSDSNWQEMLGRYLGVR
jgi:ABC-type amino acid transport substrate-binding protein